MQKRGILEFCLVIYKVKMSLVLGEEVFLRGLWIVIAAALLSGCPDVLLKVVDDDDINFDDNRLEIVDIDDIDEEDTDTEITVEVLIDDVIESDETAEVTLSIRCDGRSVAVTPTKRKAKNSRVIWEDIELDDYRDSEGDDDVLCIVKAKARIDYEDQEETTEFRIRGSIITAKVTGSRLSFVNAEDDQFVSLVREDNSSSACRANLVIWPSGNGEPSFVISGENRGVAGARITRGKVEGLHLTGDARRCQLKVGKTLVDIPDDYEYDSDVIKGVDIYDSSRIRVFHNSDSSRTVDIVIYEGAGKKISTTRTLASNSTQTYITISNAYFERRVDYTVWVRYYNRVVQFTGVDGTW